MDKPYVNVNIFILKRTVFQLLLLCLISKPLAIRLVKAGKHNLYNLPHWFSRKTWYQDPDGRWSLKATCWFHITQTQFKVYVETQCTSKAQTTMYYLCTQICNCTNSSKLKVKLLPEEEQSSQPHSNIITLQTPEEVRSHRDNRLRTLP